MITREKFPMIDRIRTGKRIKTCINRSGMTIDEVRSFLNLGSVQSIYHWMEGRSLPSLDNLYALAVLLGVTADHLLRGNYDCERVSLISFESRMRFYMARLGYNGT